MNKTLIYLILSGLFVNGMHTYLLVTQKANRKWSISEHAVQNLRVRLIYIAGHFLGGLFFLLFAQEFLLVRFHATPLFILTCVTVFFEYLQAILPAKTKYNASHSVAAYIMWFLFITIGVWSVLTLPLSFTILFFVRPMIILLVGLFLVTHFINRNYVWFMQMVMVIIFFISLLLMQLQ